MTEQLILRGGSRSRWTAGSNMPNGAAAYSAGQFTIRGDGTARFDRHYHTFGEFWFIAGGTGIVAIDGAELTVRAGDIVYTPAGSDHDIVAVGEPLRIFWLSEAPPAGASGEHLHRDPADANKHVIPACIIPDVAR